METDNNTYVYLIWNNNGLVAIAKDNKTDLYNIITDCWNASDIEFDFDTLSEFFQKKEISFGEHNNWFVEKHPINALYQKGTNL